MNGIIEHGKSDRYETDDDMNCRIKKRSQSEKITEALLQLNDEVGAQIRWMHYIRKPGFVVSLYGWL